MRNSTRWLVAVLVCGANLAGIFSHYHPFCMFVVYVVVLVTLILVVEKAIEEARP